MLIHNNFIQLTWSILVQLLEETLQVLIHVMILVLGKERCYALFLDHA